MPTLVARLREVVSAQEDDFFGDDTLLYYLNKAQLKVVSTLVQIQRQHNRSLRALDKLRNSQIWEVGEGQFTELGEGLYKTSLSFPISMKEFDYIEFQSKTPLKELTQGNLSKLKWGNVIPSKTEGYFLVGNNSFTVYVHDNEDLSEVEMYFTETPQSLVSISENLVSLPETLENAVIYGAAVMVVLQESVGQQQTNVQLYNELYQSELQAASY